MTNKVTKVTTAQVEELARLTVEVAAGVECDERVIVLTDPEADQSLAEALAAVANEKGAEALIVSFPFITSNDDLSDRVIDCVEASDVTIAVCKSNILYSRAIEAAQRGGRVLYLAEVPTELLVRPAVVEADWDEIIQYGDVFGRLLDCDCELQVTASNGTDATMRMKPGGLHVSSCRVRETGERDYLPGGAWYGAPIEESVNGTFVVDCSLEPGLADPLVAEPIALTYKSGRLVSIEGGSQAKEFEEWLKTCDSEIYGFSHNGAGFNRRAEMSGRLHEDERIFGAFCVAGGSNWVGWPSPGTNRSAAHFDGMTLNASYSKDGVPLFEDGQPVHPELVSISS